MFRTVCRTAAAVLAASLVGVAALPAQAGTDQQDLVDKARITINDLRSDKEFGNARQLLQRARAVLVVPALVKGGFFVGGEGGDGVLLARQPRNAWSDPAFYTLASASFGLQIGLQQSEVILIVLTDRALNAFMSDEFKVGAQAGLAIVTLGSMAEAATTSALNADIVVWSSSTGLYGGLTLNGSLIKPRDSYNEAYYGHAESPTDIVIRHAVHNPGAASLIKALSSIS